MIYSYGTKSELALAGCHLSLQRIMREALAVAILDITIIEGYRPKEIQHQYFLEGKSRVDAGNPKAMHCHKPSLAADAVPYINGVLSWNHYHCSVLAGIILTCSKKLGYTIRWGGNWDQDGEPITDQSFQDLAHCELIL